MPHLFVNRPRRHKVHDASADLRDHFMWETINAVLYKLGGVVFIVGSILFFPAFEAYADLGAWTFFFGSLLYLVVTGHDLAEVLHNRRAADTDFPDGDLELTAALVYVVGTVLFTVGSLLFLSWVGLFTAGAWCFVIGSLLFVVGACINVLQIVQARSLLTLQLMNLTAVSFVVGAVLFTVASVPYLWHLRSPGDQRILYGFLAWQYLIGSLLFFLGGVFNYWRAAIVIRSEMAARYGD